MKKVHHEVGIWVERSSENNRGVRKGGVYKVSESTVDGIKLVGIKGTYSHKGFIEHKPIGLTKLISDNSLKWGDEVLCTHPWGMGKLVEGEIYRLVEVKGRLKIKASTGTDWLVGDGLGVGFIVHKKKSESEKPMEKVKPSYKTCVKGGKIVVTASIRSLENHGCSIAIEKGDRYTISSVNDTGVRVMEVLESNHLKFDQFEFEQQFPEGFDFVEEMNLHIKPEGKQIMSLDTKFKNVPVATPTIIFGVDIEDLSPEEFFSIQRDLRDQIKAYDDLPPSVLKVNAVEALEDQLKEITNLVNAHEEKKTK